MKENFKTVCISVFFIFYCTALGAYLLLRPWAPDFHSYSPYWRGFVSGVGIIHLYFGLRDLLLLLARTGGTGKGNPSPQ